jgi:hypothetical protein
MMVLWYDTSIRNVFKDEHYLLHGRVTTQVAAGS